MRPADAKVAPPRGPEGGVALLAVLLLVAILATLATGILEDLRFSQARARNGALLAQTRYYALGAEALARARIAAIIRANPDRSVSPELWQNAPQIFPIEGGAIRVTLRDGGNCFNLNSVVSEVEGRFIRRDGLRPTFIALARTQAISVEDAGRIFDALSDWIDSDQLRFGAGAEDDFYLAKTPFYRTGGGLLAEVSEMRAIDGVSAEIYAKLRPFLCALPNAELAPINVNTLVAAQAPLLVMLSEGRLAPETARQVIVRRPEGGYGSVADFWSQPLLAAAKPPAEALQSTKLVTRFFAFDLSIAYRGVDFAGSSLMEVGPTGEARLRARRWTPDE